MEMKPFIQQKHTGKTSRAPNIITLLDSKLLYNNVASLAGVLESRVWLWGQPWQKYNNY